ncbi:uncharacterized protein LOC119006457 isoform X1 [Acanthopagrus latus]|uniref:uncharacterized protein LOC119006457 isoform X1 n=2 Tax=Acanthopagrus latus TaxID=8177 RepID=UPI00187C695C|nr:uncharacterized protein LOC119006457 isoform X1 [Acanthopagrus latus]
MIWILDSCLLLAGYVCLFWTAFLVLTLACLIHKKLSMDFMEGSRGIYRPIRVLFDRPIYEQALQICWQIGSYKYQIALLTELLRLRQKKQLPSEVTAEDMKELLVEESKSTLRVRLWESALEDFDDTDAKPLLRLGRPQSVESTVTSTFDRYLRCAHQISPLLQVWDVNTDMKMRDIEFEARRLLSSPEALPPQFQLPKIISQTQKHARSLTKQHREATSSKLLHPRKVVMEVVPNVLQGFWLPPPNMSFNMPSQQLSKMAVGVTKAVEDRVATALSSMPRQVTFSRSIRDYMVLTVQEKFGQGYALEGLVKRLNGFEAEVLNIITGISAGEICMLFHSQSCTKVSVNMNYIKDCIQPAAVVRPEARTSLAEDEEPGLEGDTVPIQQTVAAVTSFPPVSLTLTAEPPISIGLHKTETQPVEVVESFNTTTGVKQTETSGFNCFFSWLRQNICCCCFLSKDDMET